MEMSNIFSGIGGVLLFVICCFVCFIILAAVARAAGDSVARTAARKEHTIRLQDHEIRQMAQNDKAGE